MILVLRIASVTGMVVLGLAAWKMAYYSGRVDECIHLNWTNIDEFPDTVDRCKEQYPFHLGGRLWR